MSSSKVFCCGNTQNGELGLGGIEQDHILSARKQRLPYDRRSYALISIASGRYHTLMLLRSIRHERNVVFSCGSNEREQLGRTGSWKRLEQVEALSHHSVAKITCGTNHSMVLTEAGQLFTWGCNLFGQLGLGSIDQQEIGKPSLVKKLATKHVVQIACGGNHCVALTKNCELYSWGSNAFGQLGLGSSGNCVGLPTVITSLQWTPILQISAGGSHSAIVSYTGALYLWGKNDFGQLGLSDTRKRVSPTLQRSLRDQRVAYVNLGEDHSAILTAEGGLFTFGAGMYGQLGHGRTANEILPRKVFELMGVPIVQVSCGRCHTLAANKYGRVYSFGLNGSGQLGLGSNQLSLLPMEVPGSWVEINVRDILLRNSNRSLTIFNDKQNKKSPTNDTGSYVSDEASDRPEDNSSSDMEIDEVDETSSSSDPGSDSADCVVEEPDDVPTSSAASNQNRNSPVRKLPGFLCDQDNTVFTCKDQCLQIDEYESDPDSDVEESSQRRPLVVSQVVASRGDQTFIIVQPYYEKVEPLDDRRFDPANEIWKLDNAMFEQLKDVPKSGALPLEIVDYIEEVFASAACWNASYLHGQQHDKHNDTDGLDGSVLQLCKYMTALGIKTNDSMEKNNCLVDWQQAFHGFNMIEDAQHVRMDELIHQNMVRLLSNMPDVSFKKMADRSDYLDEEVLRVYQLLPLSHMFRMSDIHDRPAQQLITLFANAILSLSPAGLDCLRMKWCRLEKRYLASLITIFKKSIELNLLEQHNANTKAAQENLSKEQQFRNLCQEVHQNISCCLQVLKLLFTMNKATQIVSYQTFYIPGIADKFDLSQDYIAWKQSRPTARGVHNYLCNYPFIFDPPAKNMILVTDSMIQQQNAANNTVYAQIMANAIHNPQQSTIYVNPYLNLIVHRKTILHETINQLCTMTKHSALNFKRPLRVYFEGEEAIDAGQGMKKEFFLLLMREMLDEKYGMFVEYKETKTIWFQHSNNDDLTMYELVGILCGLAIYNNVIINLPFPLVLYKKILNEKLEVDDLASLDPVLAKNLKEIVNTSFDREEFNAIYGDLNFTIVLQTFGSPVEFELCPGGKEKKLTFENRYEYVQLYWQQILVVSIEPQFKAFNEGFMKVLDTDILQIFHAEELMQLVSGQDVIDWEELEEATEYKPPFTKNHPTIKLFWSVFHGFSNDEKKKFLLFLTGSDRIPTLGVKALNLVIQPMKVDDDHLPVAHTCFNILDLPQDYSVENGEAKLREKLVKACEFTEGFALA